MTTDLTPAAPAGPARECATPVLDRRTGELIPLEHTATTTLAAIVDDLAQRRAELDEDEALLNGELLDRLDRMKLWTIRTPLEDGQQFQIKAPSPTAGTTAIDAGALRVELERLLADGDIDAEAARAIVRRSVSIVAYVDVTTDLAALKNKLERLTDIAGVSVYNVVITTNEHAPDAGVKRLATGGHADVVARCRVPRQAPARKAKVTRKDVKR